ncbi:Glycosyltransferase involved in cell wall bisynthesis [Natronoarchaeum philippinense]|uniref:Glycosyltransferase involved in cell wall bisynthesis n=1 Tax=Natronoarchaeum philippinense TaxID=558529 RepID=A0A285P2E1_NATPI|nr:glycosyltransferase family 4 protein [Natronoarchaeum philippinense]SNZ15909.1 Glycosyltransferase involved in cell wall bisynthesis [Natronoarchaeum philippinense]
MRVALVSLTTTHHRDAAPERRLRQVAMTLAGRGHDVHVFCAKWWDGTDNTVEDDELTYHAVTLDRTARQSFLLRVPVMLARADPDIVHAGARYPPAITAASIGATLARTPLLADWYDPDGADGGFLTRRALSAPDRIVTPSRLVRTRLREHGADMERLQVVPNAVDFDLIRSTDPADERHVVYARRLDEGANVESLLLGLAELRDFEWSATVIGDGPARESYEQQARDLRIDDRIDFVGELSREERVSIYRNAHVFVQTAHQCRFATELAWALACGCVGIVEYHADSSAHELVEGRERGFRTTSEQELADAIREAGEMESLTVDEEFAGFGTDAVLDQYLDLYRDLRAQYGLL